MAGKDFGGTMRLRDAAGRNLSLRGTFTNYPSGRSSEHITNQDGSVDRVITPSSPRCEITIVDKNVDLAALIGAPRQPISIIEDHTGVVHNYIDAFYTGDPAVNRLTGETTGLMVVGEAYRKLES